MLKSLFNRVAGGPQLYQKQTVTQMFPCRIYKISKNTKFEDCERLLLKPVLSPELPFLIINKTSSSRRMFAGYNVYFDSTDKMQIGCSKFKDNFLKIVENIKNVEKRNMPTKD